MSTVASSAALVVVVDPEPSDYAALVPLVETGRIDLRFLLTGRSALRHAGRLDALLWMINVELPDRSGFDLFEMLADRLGDAYVILVADRYRAEDERRSLGLGATKYLCKPLDSSWIHDLRLHHPL